MIEALETESTTTLAPEKMWDERTNRLLMAHYPRLVERKMPHAGRATQTARAAAKAKEEADARVLECEPSLGSCRVFAACEVPE